MGCFISILLENKKVVKGSVDTQNIQYKDVVFRVVLKTDTLGLNLCEKLQTHNSTGKSGPDARQGKAFILQSGSLVAGAITRFKLWPYFLLLRFCRQLQVRVMTHDQKGIKGTRPQSGVDSEYRALKQRETTLHSS